jgi:hypothetical protein
MVTMPEISHTDPWATHNEDGTITLHWPDDMASALCSRELIEQMVNHHNKLMPLLDEATREWAKTDRALAAEYIDAPDPRPAQIRKMIGLQS